jgi:hypothetical protein
MKHLFFSLFAIGVAAVAAMTATTAMLNAPHHSVQPAIVSASAQPEAAALAPDSKPATSENAPPATPGANADKSAKPAGAAKSSADKDKDEDTDKDPYEGIAPEELPPDMQYSADSSVSFPTNI